ncbi:hypothetical protein DV701_02680 [Ornithinimicrobium avium]|uniref:Uncharacterized protein n=1 Tax=Ornithinimicrobium avium TaxID=2283195 RepID=A0A345NJI8_9MICO|nr:hypothetical protein DV701_02680 [Ornithinimicrobium avium]
MSGRRLCRGCYRDLAALTGAGVSLSSGGGVRDAVVTGLGTRNYAGAFSGEAQAARQRREKLDRTTGFWRRLVVRVVG